METTTKLSPRSVAAGEGKTLRVISDLVTWKASAAETGGAYSLFETRTPVGGGTPPHLQRYEDEAFFVLSGTYTFLVDGEQIEIGAGGYAFVPRDTVHAFSNNGDEEARMLILVTPGGIHENFFAEVGVPVDAPMAAPDIPWMLGVAAKYGLEILPPAEG